MYLLCYLAAFLGQVVQIALKIRALNKKARKANQLYGFKDYVRDDFWTMFLGFVFPLGVLIFADEVMNWKDWLVDYIKGLFFFVGLGGAELVSKIYSAGNDKVNNMLANFTKEKTDA